jgi:tripartite-type tricarboxylate transporter receptor subunit TctC
MALAATPAVAQKSADYYAGKQVKVIVGAPAGGGYDVYGRLLGRHIGRHIPGNPTVIVVNMPGAVSLNAANYLANVGPKDGTEMLLVIQSLPLVQLSGASVVRFDLARFNWIGNMSDSATITFAWHTSGVRTIEDARKRELVVGATAAAALGGLHPEIMNRFLGTRFKIIYGYKGGDEIDLAMERGEISGRGGTSWLALKAVRQRWIEGKQINILAQVALKREPDLADVPLIQELAENEEARQALLFYSQLSAVGRAIAVADGVPAEPVAILRKAFDAAVADPALIADADRQKLEFRPSSGEELQKVVTDMLKIDPRLLVIPDEIRGEASGAKGGKGN